MWKRIPLLTNVQAVAARWLVFFLAALVLFGIPSFSLRGEDERPTDRVVILYTGETHGNVEPCG